MRRRKKAEKVARYYHAHINFMGRRPILRDIASHFGLSEPWAFKYLTLATRLGLLDREELWLLDIDREEL
jgi:hypothetical protein